MKMKSLAALGMAGLLAATVVYVTPAMADDAADAAAMPNPAGMDQIASASDNSMQQNDDSQSNDNSSSSSTNNDNAATPPDNNSAPSAGSSDPGSPDTATGDDDY